MKTRALAALSVLAFTAAIAPLTALPSSGDSVSYDLATRQYDPSRGGEYTGRMRLRISPDGIVSGTFMNTEGRVSSVVGGLTGENVWFQIGNAPATRQATFNGTLIDGRLKATAPHGRDRWFFEGVPKKF
jgi:hypothetical protein